MPPLKAQLPHVVTRVPGPRSRELASRLGRVESRNVTCLAPTPPIFWERASGANVWDVDGNRFVDVIQFQPGMDTVPELVDVATHSINCLPFGVPTKGKVFVRHTFTLSNPRPDDLQRPNHCNALEQQSHPYGSQF